jgi:uncharacterized membrane protein
MLVRFVLFSDAVFAVAITRLVVEIGLPHLPSRASNAEHLRELAPLDRGESSKVPARAW